MRFFTTLLPLALTGAAVATSQLNVTETTATQDLTWVDVARICRNHDSRGGECKIPVVPGFDDPDEPTIEDMAYFAFTSDNIEQSRIDDWYCAWSLARQDSAEWTEYGEWNLFAMDYLHDANFECELTYPSCNPPARAVLQKMYPDDRPLVRRIHFTFIKYQKGHDYVLAIDGAFNRAQHTAVGLVPGIVKSFTLQADPENLRICAQMHFLVEQTINLAMMATASIANSYITRFTQIAATEGEIAKKSIADFWRSKPAGYVPDAAEALRLEKLTRVVKHAKKVAWLAPTLVKGDPKITFPWYSNIVMTTPSWLAKEYGDLLGLYQGTFGSIGPSISHGHLCASFEGDFVDQSGANRDKLAYRISAMFNTERELRQAWFKETLRGNMSAPGEPSLTSVWFKNRAWVGPGSVSEEMKDITKLEKDVATGIVKALITDTLINDFNYIKCGFQEDAPRRCEDAKTATGGNAVSIFCPYPDTDPHLMCDAKRWYFSDHGPHDIPMVASESKLIESFADGRYNLTKEMIFQESFRNYELNGRSSKDIAMTGQSAGFKIPVCITDKPHFFEARGFPAICGGWRSEETTPFLEAMHAGVGSQIYEYRHRKQPQSLYTRIIPKILDDYPPLTRYLGLCDNGLRFPHKGMKAQLSRWIGIQQGRDEDCGLIREGIISMENEEQANRWFCTNQAGHTIFEREKGNIDTPSRKAPMRSHAKKCKSWLKAQGKPANDTVMATEEELV